MSEWYEWTNGLETDVPPLDEMAAARIKNRVRAALPRRRRHRWLVAAIAAMLVLSACGYAAATGQFSQWFWNVAEDPQTPETSEDLLASMGTVIGQSQTADGVTVTLDGALWDGSTLMLSLTLDGEDLPASYWSSVSSEDSWLSRSRDQARQTLETYFPSITAEDLESYLDHYMEMARFLGGTSYTYLYNDQTDAHNIQITGTISGSASTELTLHLENLDVNGSVIQGPFEFTFPVELRSVELVYLGEAAAEFAAGYPVYVTKVVLSPFQAGVAFTGAEALDSDESDDPVKDLDLSLNALRVNGQEITGISGMQQISRSYGPDGSWNGSVRLGPFRQVVDPAAVEAICINGVWLELSQMELMED